MLSRNACCIRTAFASYRHDEASGNSLNREVELFFDKSGIGGSGKGPLS